MKRFSEFHGQLKSACRQVGVSIEVLGRVGPSGRYPMMLVRAGAKRGPTTCLVYGVHGNEPSGPLGALDFIKRHLKAARLKRVLILPCVNPWGFDFRKRENASGLDLNRDFVAAEANESRLIRKLLLRERPRRLLSFHEDDELKGIYYYLYGKVRDRSPIAAMKKVTPAFAFTLDRKKIYGAPAKNGIVRGLADGSLEHAASVLGVVTAICCEVPDCLDIRNRTRLVSEMSAAALAA